MRRVRSSLLGILLAVPALLVSLAALGDSNGPAVLPHTGKAHRQEILLLSPETSGLQLIELGAADDAEIEAVRQVNADRWDKRLQIGIGRDVAKEPRASSTWLRWEPVAEGLAAHWKITSAGAHALRIELEASRLPPAAEIRVAEAGGAGTVYGPFTAADIPVGTGGWWSPVLEGDSAVVEVFVPPGDSPAHVSLAVTRVSHLFVSPADRNVDALAKASGACEVDLICRSASDAALAQVGRAVAKMTFSDGLGGGTFLCTGTLLNPVGGSLIPYFFSAAHCISTQASASTLTTHWFYDRTGCGSGSTGAPYVQLPGGATLLFVNDTTDALLLRLNQTPPAGAVYAGWESATMGASVPLTAVHHPQGDWKKVSLGTMGGFSAFGGGAGSDHLIALWNSTATGVTEGGSSGSGIFTTSASGYQLRGGLHGGPSSCAASGTDLRDYYSRFDLAYPSISQYLNPSPSCSYSLSPTSVSLGSGATAGSFTVTTTAGCTWSATSGAGWILATGSGSGSGSVPYSVTVNPGSTSRSGTVTVGGQTFTITQAGAPATFALTVSRSGSGFGTLTSSPAGIACGATCAAEFPSGNAVTLTATAGPFSTFAGWSGGGCSGTSTCQVTMDAARSVTATFVVDAAFDVNVRTVITGYYWRILGRSPDPAGLDYWAGEAARVAGLGADVREVFFAMSIAFFGSAEYLNRGASDTQYLSDLYGTFFTRLPDPAGLAFWQGELNAIQSRSALLNSFLFSTEFSNQMTSRFGTSSVRPEVNMTIDLYRGTFGRLPDTGGFIYWLGEIRKAQCQGAAQVSAAVNNLSGLFFNSPEYAARVRNNRDFVGDVYNAYLRRGPGGDSAGFSFWVGQVPVMGRDGIRGQFIPSPEFQDRVTAVVNAGCLP